MPDGLRKVPKMAYSKPIQALTSEGIVSVSPDILREMLDKHPQSSSPAYLPVQFPALHLSSNQLL